VVDTLCVYVHSPGTGSPLSVAVLQPQLTGNGEGWSASRMMGGSWVISVSSAPLMLLPEHDVAAEVSR
jgi:hypothetical protein